MSEEANPSGCIVPSSRLKGTLSPVSLRAGLASPPLVSILIPAYNAEKWVGQAIQSALTQTWPNKEIIVVNDGSGDQTLEAASPFESRCCKVVSQENRGASSARNRALSLAQGDFIQWLDADDLLAPDKIERQLQRLEPNPNTRILLSSAFCRFYHRTANAKFLCNSLCRDLDPLEFMLIQFRENLWMNPSAWLVSRTLTQIAGPWDETLTLNDDGEYFGRVVLSSERILFVPEARSYKRIGIPGSLSGRTTPQACRSQFQSMMSTILRVLEREDSERVRESCLMLLQRLLIFFYPEKRGLMDEMYELARSLGGSLAPPRLEWRYWLIQKVFGWGSAKKVKYFLPNTRRVIGKNLDRMLETLLPYLHRLM